MRTVCLMATGVFALFAYLQLNDLDQYGTQAWYAWLLLYGSVAAVSLLSARTMLPRWVYLAGGVLGLVGAVLRSTGIDWDATVLYNESNPAGNEAGGLLLVALWMAALLVWSSRASSAPSSNP